MEYFVQFQLNVYAFLMLMVIYATIVIRSKISSLRRSFLIHLLMLTAISVILEPLTWILDRRSYPGAYFFEYFTNFLLYLIAPMIISMFLNYIDYAIFHKTSRLKKRLYYLHPTILTFIILIINIFYPIYFYVNSDNTFISGGFDYMHHVIVLLSYFYVIYFSYKYRKLTPKYENIIFAAFFIFPMIGAFLSIMNNHLYFAWTSIAFGIFVVYIFIESSDGEVDFLTRLYNRNSFETYIKDKIDNQSEFKVLSIDFDHFKAINDTYGHLKGDQILYEFGQCLVESIAPSKMAARLGGDEFICVIEHPCTEEEIISRIKMNISLIKDEVARKLEFSYGFQSSKIGDTMDVLYTEVDKKLYEDKKNKKRV